MARWEAKDPHFEERTRRMLKSMPITSLFGFLIGKMTPGLVPLTLPFSRSLTFNGTHFQASAVTALIDFAGGLAAYSLLPADSSIATMDVSVKLLAPATGDQLLAVGRSLSNGQHISVSQVDVFAQHEGTSTLCATGLVGLRNLLPRTEKT